MAASPTIMLGLMVVNTNLLLGIVCPYVVMKSQN
jgi:hypothetical protein